MVAKDEICMSRHANAAGRSADTHYAVKRVIDGPRSHKHLPTCRRCRQGGLRQSSCLAFAHWLFVTSSAWHFLLQAAVSNHPSKHRTHFLSTGSSDLSCRH